VQDADVPTWWAGLGLPGLADIHVHFLPANIQRAVWAQFDTAGPKIGRSWPITYRDPVEQRIQILRSLGVRWFTALPYAHRPGVAAYLNDWATELARATPDCLQSATFYPEPGATDDVRARLDAGAQVFKVHVQVGEFDPGDPLLHDVWGCSRTPARRSSSTPARGRSPASTRVRRRSSGCCAATRC
jgi:hypothetical protein